MLASLQDQVDYLRNELSKAREEHAEEIRRKDLLLAAARERIPALEEAPSEPRVAAETGTDLKPGVSPQGEDAGPERGVSRPWWRKLFSG